jgi:hypothetical protein
VHPRIWDLLPGFVPGLFFEICVLLANPESIKHLIAPAGLDRYAAAVVALILAFILGTAFMYWARLLQSVEELIYNGTRALWVRFLQSLLKPKGSNPSRFATSYWVNKAYRHAQREFRPGVNEARSAWQQAAAQLLKRRYGIEHPKDWGHWSGILGTPPTNFLKGYLLSLTMHATAWSGFAAAYFAASLRVQPYYALLSFLIGYSWLNHWRFLTWWNDPVARWSFALHAVLADIPTNQSNDSKTAEN